ncbi:MAG: ABC transporter substrate-binding protein [Chthonomonadales bacterium]
MKHWVSTGAAWLLISGIALAGPHPAHAPRIAPHHARPYYANTPAELVPYKGMLHKAYVANFYETPQKWLGPGRSEREPTVRQVKIGFLGPTGSTGPLAPFGKQMLQGAQMAIADANAAGGYKGRPFVLCINEDKARWGDSSNSMVKMYCDQNVWAVLGTVDSANSHVMMRITLKLPIPVVNSATTDQTLMEHRVPFITRVIPDDRQYAYATVWYLFKDRGYRNVALLRINNRDGRFAIRKLMDGARRLGHPFIFELRFNDGDTDFSEQLQRIKDSPADAVVVWGNPRETALIARQMRRMGMQQPIVGWFRAVDPETVRIGGEDVEGMVCPFPYDPQSPDPLARRFRERFRKRYGQDPGVFAAYAYDGMKLLTDAIKRAGLNRVRIGDALLHLKAVRGVTGPIIFDGARNNVRRIYLAQLIHHKFSFRPATVPRPGLPEAEQSMARR